MGHQRFKRNIYEAASGRQAPGIFNLGKKLAGLEHHGKAALIVTDVETLDLQARLLPLAQRAQGEKVPALALTAAHARGGGYRRDRALLR